MMNLQELIQSIQAAVGHQSVLLWTVGYSLALLKLKSMRANSGCEACCCSLRVAVEVLIGLPNCSETLVMTSVGLVASKVMSPSGVSAELSHGSAA